MIGPKILTWDIETSPALCWTFETKNAFITPIQIKAPTRMTCWGAKWLHEDKVIFRSEYHHSTEEMVQTLWNLLDEADVSVTYNGNGFDIPHAGREFELAGLPEPSSYTSVDLYRSIKKRQKYMSHKLLYIVEQLDLSHKKLGNDGWYMWLACEGEYGEEEQRRAWNQMRRYCKGDVLAEEDLFVSQRSKISNMPSSALWLDEKIEEVVCPDCLSDHVQRRGYRRTKVRRYPQYQCQDCGRWFSETRSDLGTGTT